MKEGYARTPTGLVCGKTVNVKLRMSRIDEIRMYSFGVRGRFTP